MLRRSLSLAVMLLVLLCGRVPVALAQTEATLAGVVTDESKGVLPGVTINGTETSSGRQYSSVTDGRGEYRLPSVPPGTYRVQAELTGFTTVVIPRVELLVGQDATLPFSLAVATVQETITVTGEAPLINTQSVEVGGNIDRRQMEELPIQGRNWMELSLLVKGVTANAVAREGNRPSGREDQFQLNLDGQQITQGVAGSGFGQPRMSREAIAEYQVLTNMYDVTMGRSVGMQVQAVSRAGTNQTSGSVYGYFRDDTFNAKDFISDTVLPYSNQQVGFSLGGPIVRDRFHYFGTYEYEHEPQTSISTPSALPGQSLTLANKIKSQNLLARADSQFGSNNHLVVRGTYWTFSEPFDSAEGNVYPTAARARARRSAILTANWSNVLSNRAVQEIKGGYYYYAWEDELSEGNPAQPRYVFPGFTVASGSFLPQQFWQKMPSVRYDLNVQQGAHDLKIGGEYLHRRDGGYWPNNARGTYTFSSLPADIAQRFPISAWNDPSRWNLAGLDSIAQRFDRSFALSPDIDIPRKTWALWLSDTWRLGERLTMNAGLRWDVDWGALAPPGPNGTEFEDRTLLISNGFDNNVDVGYKASVRDLDNISPRLGLVVKVDDTLVVRSGFGVFVGNHMSELTFGRQLNNGQNVITLEFPNDRLPGFVQDPMRGITADDVLAGRVPSQRPAVGVIPDGYQNPQTYQANLGFQKQAGETIGFDADLLFVRGTNLATSRDINVFYDPATGYPRNVSTGRPLPNYGAITWYESSLESEQLALATSFTRRYRDRWQAGLTYTHTFYQKDQGTGAAGYTGVLNNVFCISCEWAPSVDFQRHTLRMNAVYQAPWDITIAGMYSFGSGTQFPTTFNANPFGLSAAANRIVTAPVTIPETVMLNDEAIEVRDRFDGPATMVPGDVVPRNALQGLPFSKVDLRLSKEVVVPNTNVRITGMLEVFNLLNHANFGNYNGQVNSSTFGRPVQSTDIAYQPRIVQLAFRVGF